LDSPLHSIYRANGTFLGLLSAIVTKCPLTKIHFTIYWHNSYAI